MNARVARGNPLRAVVSGVDPGRTLVSYLNQWGLALAKDKGTVTNITWLQGVQSIGLEFDTEEHCTEAVSRIG